MSSGSQELPTPGPGFGNVVLHHIPDTLAPSFQAAMIVYAFCLGVISLELVSNIKYDWFLIGRPGWSNPIKMSNRTAYYLARYGSFGFLLMTLLFMTLPHLHCSSFAKALNVLWLCPLVTVDYIFIQRTLALYSWATVPTCILLFLFVAEVALGVVNVIWFGDGYQLPNSDFCAYLTRTNMQPHSSIFIAYYVVVIVTDTLILVMTVHRLTEGGLMGVPKAVKSKFDGLRKGDDAMFDEKISSLLISQGLHYYLLLEVARIVFLVVYYSVSGETSYQVLVLAVLAAIAPLLAGRLFRKTSEAAQRVQGQRSQQSTDRQLNNQLGSLRLTSPTTPMSPGFTDLRRSHSSIGYDDMIHRDVDPEKDTRLRTIRDRRLAPTADEPYLGRTSRSTYGTTNGQSSPWMPSTPSTHGNFSEIPEGVSTLPSLTPAAIPEERQDDWAWRSSQGHHY